MYVHGDTLHVSGTQNADALLDSDPVDMFNNIKANKHQHMIDYEKSLSFKKKDGTVVNEVKIEFE